jgi:phenylacetic acid degradation operon negative regulatory protein
MRGDGTESGAGGTAVGLSTRELLIVIIGDWWHRCTAPLPSAALVAMLGELGAAPANSRAALSRLSRRGTLEVSKVGRRTFYNVTGETAAWAEQRGKLLMRFGLDWPGWDGRWTCVAFSLPDDVNRTGPVLRTGLRRLGMAQLYDGFWVSPHDLTESLGSLLAEVGVPASTVLRADPAAMPSKSRDPVEAWDLEPLRARYLDLTAELGRLADRLAAGRIGPAESFAARTATTVAWRKLVYDDPRLPRELLPPDWPMEAARAAFVTAYDGLGPLAESRARQVVAEFDLPDGAQPRHHTVADGM